MKNHPVLRSPKFKRAVQQRQGKNYGLYTMSSKARAQSDENQIGNLKKCYTFHSKPRYSTTYKQEAVDLLCPRLININIMLISLSKQVNIATRTTVFDQSWPNLSQEHRLKWLKAPKVDMWKCHFQQNNVIHAIYYFIYVKKKSISTKGPFWNEAVNRLKKKNLPQQYDHWGHCSEQLFQVELCSGSLILNGSLHLVWMGLDGATWIASIKF